MKCIVSSFRNFWFRFTPLGLYLVSSILYLYFLFLCQKFWLLRIPVSSVICFGPEYTPESRISKVRRVKEARHKRESATTSATNVTKAGTVLCCWARGPDCDAQYHCDRWWLNIEDWWLVLSTISFFDSPFFLLRADPSRDLPYFKALGIVLPGCLPPTGSSLNSLYFWFLGNWFFSI